jgi:hypothetical protein
MDVKFQKMKKKTKLVGSFSYSDPATPISFSAMKITSLTFTGNQAHFSGTAKIGKTKVTFTVDVTDNGDPGTNDFFSLHVSNGYSASGFLSSGNISVR